MTNPIPLKPERREANPPAKAEDAAERAISPIEEIIEDARNGRPYILVDAEDRENEGDVIIPAQFATPDQINFMAKHARGLICLSITAERARQLRLPPMTADNGSGHGTAFTVSIEAREGVTTGISAHDRAHTIAVAVDPTKGPDDIVSPGHVFPLVAKAGGVLVRAGHTEAAVDISRLAGLNPAGVICEIMKDDGSMARLPDLVAFAQLHGLKIGTIADLIAYRRRTERQVERVLETPFDSAYGGRFRMVIYRNILDRTEHVVLTKGRIEPDKPTLVRMHRVDFATDMLGAGGGRRDYVPAALKAIAEHDGAGVAVFIRDSDPSWLSDRYGQDGAAHAPANILRDYGVGAQILLDLGVRDLILLSNSDTVLPGSAGYGLRILGRRALG
ncbi:MAG: 3,4-dihydroxy-2-butanone-4-phosphate synthase [Pseudomonadota bacterium]